MLKSYLKILSSGKSLTRDETREAIEYVLTSDEPIKSAVFLALLHARGETVEEVEGVLSIMQEKALPIHFPRPVMDIVGTGGDFANTVNISTGAAILAAACGIPIAKHGGRSISSQSGAADVLEEFGIDIMSSPKALLRTFEEVNIAFMFAPNFHPMLKRLAPLRKELGLRTIFNLLGPLLNPAQAEFALIGVANEDALEKMATVLQNAGRHKRALLFHGEGLDELSTLGKTRVYDIQGHNKSAYLIDPEKLGMKRCSLKDLQGGNSKENALILQNAFLGISSAVSDTLVLNAGAAIWIYGQAPTLENGIQIARRALNEGKALNLIQRWKESSQKNKRSESI